MEISATLVKELRERTGAPMMNCKSALTEAGGDLAAAEVLLRKKGIASAAKKSTRSTTEGSVGAYIHAGGKIGVLLEIACESDFVARTEEFQQLVHDVAMHVAAADPRFLSREQVTPAILEQEKDIYRAQVKAMGKPEAVVEKIVEGKLAKFYEEACLLDQHFVKDDKMTIAELVASKIAKFGENIAVRRFARFTGGDEV
ncbi:MAG: translation elongation factor Ts [Terriglobales bacterium]